MSGSEIQCAPRVPQNLIQRLMDFISISKMGAQHEQQPSTLSKAIMMKN
jgi:hypothetical protein